LNRTFKLGIGAMASAGLLGFCGSSQGTIITQNNVVIASDTYEGDTLGGAPVADVGTWSNDGSFYFNRDKGVVTNAASPGPASGSQYLSLGGASGQQHSLNLTLAAGDVLKFDSMVYMSAGQNPIQFILFGGPNGAAANRLLDFYRNSNGTWGATNVAGSFAGPTSFTANTWQHWVVDYTVGAANATLTIDGVSASIPASHTNLVSSNGFLSIITNGTDPTYLDNVPEPASLSLLSLGGLALLRRKKRMA
jgi:hypothetical protein